jgi:Nif-specific regulatory protein
MASPLDAERSQLLYDLSCAFSTRLDLDELVPHVISRCREVMKADGVAVLLHDPERDELYFPYASGADPSIDQRLRELRLPADEGVASVVLSKGVAQLVEDVTTDPRWYGKIDEATGARTRSLLSAPLRTRNGPIGVIEVVNGPDRPAFTEDDLDLLDAMTGPVAIAIENARMYSELQARERTLKTQIDVMRRDIARHDRFGNIVGQAPSMQRVFHLMEKSAASPISVLIEGDTGTGKELVARGIHDASPRADEPFLAVNCAALSRELLESELFGHVRGAFTGADKDRVGLFEAASRGTVFLDEIGEMQLQTQVKLLRVLQEQEVTRVGNNVPRKVDFRLIAATNRDLSAAAAAGTFRQDLYYRVAAFPIVVPPLCERREDIPLLVEHFVALAAKRHKRKILGVEPAAFSALCSFDWPGNIRELQNEIERAVALTCDGETIDIDVLSEKLGGEGAADLADSGGEVAAGAEHADQGASISGDRGQAVPLREARTAFEIDYVRRALERNDRNVTRTARALGISRVMLQKKMAAFDLR